MFDHIRHKMGRRRSQRREVPSWFHKLHEWTPPVGCTSTQDNSHPRSSMSRQPVRKRGRRRAANNSGARRSSRQHKVPDCNNRLLTSTYHRLCDNRCRGRCNAVPQVNRAGRRRNCQPQRSNHCAPRKCYTCSSDNGKRPLAGCSLSGCGKCRRPFLSQFGTSRYRHPAVPYRRRRSSPSLYDRYRH